jgi:phospholipid/cholesterol/gamma-HCH transport system ATP-binding protein
MVFDTSVLTFADARLALDTTSGVTAPIAFSLPPGGLALADLRGPLRLRNFADAASGLNPAREGAVLFQGRAWADLPPDHAAAMRGRIGRLFSHGAWIPDLPLDQNIMLPALYHTARPLGVVREEAARLAAGFGLPGLPTDLPDAVPQGDRIRGSLVRAFLNEPVLVILEEPTATIEPELLPPMMRSIGEVRDRGGAVLWLTASAAVTADRTIPASERLRLIFGALQRIGERVA